MYFAYFCINFITLYSVKASRIVQFSVFVMISGALVAARSVNSFLISIKHYIRKVFFDSYTALKILRFDYCQEKPWNFKKMP